MFGGTAFKGNTEANVALIVVKRRARSESQCSTKKPGKLP